MAGPKNQARGLDNLVGHTCSLISPLSHMLYSRDRTNLLFSVCSHEQELKLGVP